MNKQSNDFKLSKKVLEKLKDKEKLKEAFAEGKSAQEILEIPEKTMVRLYEGACKLYEHHRYADASNAFMFLVTLNAYRHDYWLGLGMATQMYGDFEAAIDAYEMAALYEGENPTPYFYLAKCLFAMHERQSALQALDIAIQYAGDLDEYQELKKQAIDAQALLRKQI